jgi:hypothetical protein
MVEIVVELIPTLQEKGHIVLADRGFGSIDLADAINEEKQFFILACWFNSYLILILFFIDFYNQI